MIKRISGQPWLVLSKASMHIDPHTQQPIHQGKIWTRSLCLDLEKTAVETIRLRLQHLDYNDTEGRGIMWHRNGKRIVLCLVDDVRHCVPDFETDMPYLFDRNTTVITDNLILCPTLYKVLNMPNSFYGIYAYSPEENDIVDRQFSFLINRLDDKRFRIMLELAKRTDLSAGYINFNCQKDFISDKNDIDLNKLKQNFADSWLHLDATQQRVYGSVYDRLLHQMPLKNYNVDHDQALMRASCNIVVESYSSDTSIAYSEKIFRALALPRPWMLYGGRYSVARLESMGFDCLQDIMHHNRYDALKEIEHKIQVFVVQALQNICYLDNLDALWLQQRCQKAALHNQKILWQFRHSWRADLERCINAHLS